MKKSFLIMMVLTLFATSVHASNLISGKIIDIRSGTWYGEKVVINVHPKPLVESCSTIGDLGHYIIDLSKPGAYAWLSLVLSAQQKQTEVQIWGTKKCIEVNGLKVEELETIALKTPIH